MRVALTLQYCTVSSFSPTPFVSPLSIFNTTNVLSETEHCIEEGSWREREHCIEEGRLRQPRRIAMELITMNARGAQNTIGYRESLPATLPHSLSHVAGSALLLVDAQGSVKLLHPPGNIAPPAPAPRCADPAP